MEDKFPAANFIGMLLVFLLYGLSFGAGISLWTTLAPQITTIVCH